MKKSFKTTKEDFEYFRERCLYWRKRFGLIDWRVTFFHENEKGMPMEGSRAAVDMGTGDLCVLVYLNRDWQMDAPTKPILDRCALHEILHLLTQELVRLGSFRFGVAGDDIPHEAHRVIRRIEAAIHGTEVE